MARFVVREWLIGVITPRLSPILPYFQLWSVSGVLEDRNPKRADSHVAEFGGESDIREPGTQFDSTNVSCHRLAQCGHPNTESPIDPPLISLCTG